MHDGSACRAGQSSCARQAISEVGGQQRVGPLKSGAKGKRDIPMMSLTRQALEFQHKVLLSRDLLVNPNSYVFPGDRRRTTGPALGKSTIVDRWKALVSKAGLPYIKFHGLRHSHGTLLADLVLAHA
ncbi:MAG: tyrosine-type recombinase/integrase [Limnochordia bacterium]